MKKIIILTLFYTCLMGQLLCMDQHKINEDDFEGNSFNSFHVLSNVANEEKIDVSQMLQNQNNDPYDNFDNFGDDSEIYAASCYDAYPSLGKRSSPDDQLDFFIQPMPVPPTFQDENQSIKKGIINETGSDCFMISSLQALKNIPEFLDVLKTETNFAQELNNFVSKLDDDASPVAGIRELRAKLTKVESLESMKRGQQDAQEFVSGILTEGACGTQKVHENFGIESKKSFLCTSCGHEWRSVAEKELLLPLHLSNYNDTDSVCIEKLINEINEEEFIQDGKCETCNQMGIVRSVNLESLPKVLMILLKRFNRIDGVEKRLNTKVLPQEELNISYENGDKKYKLCGVILHHPGYENSIQFGHYTAYTKNNAGQWYHYNDEICNEVTIEKVTIASAEPYVCFYREDN